MHASSRISVNPPETHIQGGGKLAWAVGNETADLQPEAGGESSKIVTFEREEDGRWVLVSHRAQTIAK
jgi:hypothetical protein